MLKPAWPLVALQVLAAGLTGAIAGWIGLIRGGEDAVVDTLSGAVPVLAVALPVSLLFGVLALGHRFPRVSRRTALLQALVAGTVGAIGGILLFMVVATNVPWIFGGVHSLTVQERVLAGDRAWLLLLPLVANLGLAVAAAPFLSRGSARPVGELGMDQWNRFEGAGFRMAVPMQWRRQADEGQAVVWEAEGGAERLHLSRSAFDESLDKPRRQALLFELMKKETARIDQESAGRVRYRGAKESSEGRDMVLLNGRDKEAGQRFATVMVAGERGLLALRYSCPSDLQSDDHVVRRAQEILATVELDSSVWPA